jgi:HK97 family phage major capsid protein
MKAFGGIRRLAEVIQTSDGSTLPFPTNDDTSNVGAILAENTQMTEQDVTLGTKSLGAYTYTSKLVRVSLQLLQDAEFDLDSWLARKLGERIGRAQAVHWATGTGTSQPQGLVTGVNSGVTAASTTAITADELITLQHSVDPAYREGGTVGQAAPGTAWVMNDATFAVLRKLKDADGNYLIQPDNQRGGFTTLLGYPVAIDQAMPEVGAGTRPVVFGNVRAAYVIRDARQVEVLRLVERYADYLQHGFTAWARADGLVQDANAAKALTMAAA